MRAIAKLSRRVVRGLFVHHAFDHAATMAFYFFLGTIPLLVFCGLVVGQVVRRAGEENVLVGGLGGLPLPPVALELIRTELHEIAATSGTFAPLSLLGFLWLTSNGFHNLMDVLEILTGAQPRKWWKQRLIALGWVAATLVAVILVSWLLLFVKGIAIDLADAPKQELPQRVADLRRAFATGLRDNGVVLVVVSVTAFAMAAFYRIAVVHPPGVIRRVWPGTIVALLLWTIVSIAFREYLRTIGDYAVYYGSLATVAVTLLWLYLTSLSFVIGAEVNAQLEGVRDLQEALARDSRRPSGLTSP